MALINENFLKLSESYLFTEIARKVNAYKEEHPKADIISLGIGDVTQPLAQAVIEALHKATDEMATAATFRGYGPERGYDFLREAIVENDFRARVDNVVLEAGAVAHGGVELVHAILAAKGEGLRHEAVFIELDCLDFHGFSP